jgi:hypothetical protein
MLKTPFATVTVSDTCHTQMMVSCYQLRIILHFMSLLKPNGSRFLSGGSILFPCPFPQNGVGRVFCKGFSGA